MKKFFTFLSAFTVLSLLSWPLVFSFDLWVLKDRGSFLNLDNLLAKHFRLGVDTYYSYGLLPVLIQHLLFLVFDRGYWPMIGCTIVTMVLMAMFWAVFLNHVQNNRTILVGLVLMSPIIFLVNPNFPYSLVILSILFSLYLVLENKLGWAIAVAVVGCFSVPSLPLLLLSCLLLLAVLEWYARRDSVGRLIYLLTPGMVTYGSLGLLLSLIFGWKSVIATATPFSGMRFYKAAHFSAVATSLEFLHPPGHSHLYYLEYFFFAPATWWFVSTLAIFIFGAMSFYEEVRGSGNPNQANKRRVIIICAILQVAFTFFARGPLTEYVLYEPFLVVGVLLGIYTLVYVPWQKPTLLVFLCLAVFGEAAQARYTWLAWKTTKVSADTAGLYANTVWASEWADILKMSNHKTVLFLSYGTGIPQYFPKIESADAWFIRTGQLLPEDEQRLMKKVRNSDVVVEDLTGPTAYMDKNPQLQAEFHKRHLIETNQNFKVWEK